MNDPKLLAERLEDLAKLASSASNAFEKAAVYAATTSIRAEFDAAEDEFDGYTLEKVGNACWYICAAVGYDITNNDDIYQNISQAYGQISTLKKALERDAK